MRLIDADDFKKFMQALCNTGSPYESVVELLDKQSTAYDIDKVVKELESELKKGNIAIDFGEFRLFEIVKQGVVSDDVCEWERDEHSENDNPSEWIICPHKPKRIFSKDIKYCPYCGKKIKVV